MKLDPIAVVVPYNFVPPKSGGQKAAYGICRALFTKRKTIAITNKGNDSDEAEFPVFALLGKSALRYLNPFSILPLYRILKLEEIKHVMAFQPFIAFLLLIPSKLAGCRLSIYLQNLEYQRFRSMRKWWWPLVFIAEFIAFRIAGHLYFISPDELEPGKRIFRLKDSKCSILPYGVPFSKMPEIKKARRDTRRKYGYSDNICLIIFFGPLSYLPNLEALEKILYQIEPALHSSADFPYRFLICGGALPKHFDNLRAYPNVDYLGFVEDIDAVVKACDVMVNPVNSGGGVKTKLVEAVALGTTVVSSYTGALGVNSDACGNKLTRVPDTDFYAFANAIISSFKAGQIQTPDSFYNIHAWDKIAESI